MRPSRAFALARLVSIVGLALQGLACEEPPEVPLEEVLRPVKTVRVDARAEGSLRTFSGTIVASEVSALAFRRGGTVQTVEAKLGQRVRRGQPLATLDRTPAQLEVQRAVAQVRDAEARLGERREHRTRVRSLFAAGAASRADLDSAEAAAISAAEALAAARAGLALARRDLESTVLEAPFDGIIAERDIEPYEEIAAGHTAFVLHTAGAVEIEVVLPGAVIDRVQIGDPVSVQLTIDVEGAGHYSGRVKEIGRAAVATGGFPVHVALLSDDPHLRPGLAATATFSLPNDSAPAWLIPINAFLPPRPAELDDRKPGERGAELFVFDPVEGVVRRRSVRGIGVRGNDVLVSEGLAEGERVVVAGVSFLHDGQRVRLLEEAG
jgi:RND family efflux transporter MFP subunit